MKRVVISQPMYFPWVGMLEQIRLADVFVHYDDVQFSKGSFTNRVQLKTAKGFEWMTLPVRDLHLGQLISGVSLDDRQDWRGRHMDQLKRHYSGAKHFPEMLDLAESVICGPYQGVAELAVASLKAVCDFFGIGPQLNLYSSKMGIPGESSRRVLDVVKYCGGDIYITGHGARNYLDHELFEREGVQVEYIDYLRRPYPQIHGNFTPHVSCLDLVANLGRPGVDIICSGTIPWRQMIANKSE